MASYPRFHFTLHFGESGVVSSFSFYATLRGKWRRILVFILRYTLGKAASYPRFHFTLHFGESGVVSSFSFYATL